MEKGKKNWHDKNYKKLLIIPAILLLFSVIYMVSFYSNNGDFFYKDISLTGGTSVTIYNESLDKFDLQNNLQNKLEDLNIRVISDLVTNEQKAVVIETKTDGEKTRQTIEDYLGFELNDENSSFEFTGSSLGEGFYKQLLVAILIAFIFMGIVVFIIFRNFVPSTAVILSAFADITMTLVAVNLLGIKMSTAGIVAFLMLVGYSVDTDILLTTRVLKRKEGNLNERITGAMKTGLTMTLTSLFAFLLTLFIIKSFSNILTQIFMILSIGLFFDLLNTWITNVSILKWYVNSKNE